MFYKTKAIVLNHLKYGDTSLVVTIYTEALGRKSFLVQGVYKKKSKFHATFFQPLTILDLEVDINPKRELQRIKEISFNTPFHSIPFDITKSAISLFLSEVLHKTLKEEEPNPPLFDYLYHTIQLLDINDTGVANFHLVFLINLTKYLGFYPVNNYSEIDCIFDPVNGKFFSALTSQSLNSDKVLSSWMSRLLNLSFEELETLHMNHQIRNSLLKFIIEFYNLHLGGLTNVKSLPVLQSVFEEG
ncbi:MAG TPA: DNA repair protein RecO [Bacteroidales bacterium]